jgi:hypothetical protein
MIILLVYVLIYETGKGNTLIVIFFMKNQGVKVK